jgi:hypothetical protein
VTRAIAIALLGLGFVGANPVVAVEPEALVGEVRSTQLDPERAVTLRNVELEIGLALLEIEHGILIPTRPIDGLTLELVLIGRAHFRIEPPDEIEAGQLELFTGNPELDTPVDETVLVIANQETVERLLDRPAPQLPTPAVLERAEALHRSWIENTERRSTGVESGMFKALVGDRAFRDYFAVWCLSYDTGEFVYTHDPEDSEQLTVASFTRLDVRGWKRLELARHIRIQQRKGRFLGMRVEDIGAWDVWLSAPWSADEAPTHGSVGFETRHYDLDVRIRKDSLQLEGRAVLDVEATATGRRTVSLELFRDLKVDRVVDGAGRELFAFRSGPEVVVLLPEPSRAGDRLTLEIHYGGQVLKWVGRRTFDLESTDNWYPHCGSIDRATYEVVLRWPRKFQVVASGRYTAGGQSGKYRWERRVIDIPTIAFSFVFGKFDVVRRQIGPVELTLALSRAGGEAPAVVRESTIDVIARSMDFFERTFGPYPLDHLTVVVLPRRYSQSYLGFITLTDSVVEAAKPEPRAAAKWIQETTIAHEVAHQWWGNMIGWWSYRDQWLSEAMANYAGYLFYARSDNGTGATLADMSAGWRASLEQRVESGRTVESLGPIVLGGRLNSSEATHGYRAIVYRKGAVVLSMLARSVGEENFLGMLRSLVDAAAGRVITTENFLEALERMSGLDLQGFAGQYVYGTGIPLVYYDYEIEPAPANEGWVVKGEARKLREPGYRVGVKRLASGGWDLIREPIGQEPDGTTALMVPFRVVSSERELDTGTVYQGRHKLVRSGQLMVRGWREQFEIETDMEPEELVFDPRGEILARFYSIRRSPKRFARYQAQDLIVAGRSAEAEQELFRALGEPVGVPSDPPALPWLRDDESENRKEDAAIRLMLVDLYLDRGRDSEAEAQLRLADDLLVDQRTRFRMQRDTLWARLELRAGAYPQAYRRLKQAMRLAAPRRERQDWRARIMQLQLKAERQAVTEAYALLAVAAFETGNRDDYEWARAGARERGADLAAIKPLPTEPADVEAHR